MVWSSVPDAMMRRVQSRSQLIEEARKLTRGITCTSRSDGAENGPLSEGAITQRRRGSCQELHFNSLFTRKLGIPEHLHHSGGESQSRGEVRQYVSAESLVTLQPAGEELAEALLAAV